MTGRVISSVARTNKLYCSHCYKAINRGDVVVFVLSVNDDGKDKMQDCYCDDCGNVFVHQECMDTALEDAIGHGQS